MGDADTASRRDITALVDKAVGYMVASKSIFLFDAEADVVLVSRLMTGLVEEMRQCEGR